MTAVFVNGNPETAAIWDSLLGERARMADPAAAYSIAFPPTTVW